MATGERIYRRTASGLRAIQAEEPELAPEYVRILAIIGDGMHSTWCARCCAGMPTICASPSSKRRG